MTIDPSLVESRPRGRPRTLTRAQVIQAALDLAAEKSVAEVSIRSVARRLGVRETSLYTYVDSKEDLLRRMLDEVFTRDLPLASPDDPRPPVEQLKSLFRGLRQRAIEHVELLALLGRTHSRPVGSLAAMDHVLGLLGALGLAPAQQLVVYTLLHHITVTNALLVGNHAIAFPEDANSLEHLPAPEEADVLYPHLLGVLTSVAPSTSFDEGFEDLLDVVLEDTVRGLLGRG